MADESEPVFNRESLLQFPCDFPIKIMGASDIDLRGLVLERVRQHAPNTDESRIQVRDSRAGRYQAVTVVVHAQNQAQLDAIYREFSNHPQIALVL
jgi:putative lipoic acid-binding regulatory protein